MRSRIGDDWNRDFAIALDRREDRLTTTTKPRVLAVSLLIAYNTKVRKFCLLRRSAFES